MDFEYSLTYRSIVIRDKINEFGSEIIAVLRWTGLLVIQIRLMWPIFCAEFVGLHSSFLTE